MRFSTDRDDPGFPNFERYRLAEPAVWFNGEPIEDVVTADEDAGYVIVYARAADGNFMMDRDASIVRRTFYGRVRVRCLSH